MLTAIARRVSTTPILHIPPDLHQINRFRAITSISPVRRIGTSCSVLMVPVNHSRTSQSGGVDEPHRHHSPIEKRRQQLVDLAAEGPVGFVVETPHPVVRRLRDGSLDNQPRGLSITRPPSPVPRIENIDQALLSRAATASAPLSMRQSPIG